MNLRNLIRPLAVFAVGIFLIFASPTAQAQGSISDAEAAFTRAQAAFAAKDYDTAANEFQAANKIRPLPEFQFNTARCYQKKGKVNNDPAAYQLAIDFYGRYLTAGSGTPSDAAEVGATVDVIRAEIVRLSGATPAAPSEAALALGEVSTRGVVVIESNPTSAVIYLDDPKGEVFARTPWSGQIPEGEHELFLEIRGYVSKSIKVTAAPDRLVVHTVDMVAEPSLAWIKVTANVVGAQVFFDGKEKGASGVTPYEKNILPGKHTVTVSSDGYDDFVQEFEVKNGENKSIDAQLSGAPVGYLSISGEGIQNATISVDGKVACERGPCRKGVREGSRTITASRSGFKTFSRRLEVKPGVETSMKIAFAPKPSRIDAVVTYVLAAAIAGGGVGLFLHSGNIQDEIDAETAAGMPPADDDSRRDQTKYFKYGAYGTWGIAGVTLLTAVYYTFRDKGPPSSAKVSSQQLTLTEKIKDKIKKGVRPEAGPGYGGVGLALAF